MIQQQRFILVIEFLVACAVPASAQNGSSPGHNVGAHYDSRNSVLDPIRVAYREGQDRQALVLADQALFGKTQPVSLRATIHFWRGASLRRLRRHEEALVSLNTAKSLGLKSPELLTERAIVLKALGQDEEAKRSFQEAEDLLQDDPEKLDQLRRRWQEGSQDDERFRLRIYPTLGFDTNVVAMDEDAILSQGDTERDSFYYGFVLSARFLAFENRDLDMALTLEYQNDVRGYASESGLSYTDNLLSAVFSTRIGKLDWLSFEARGFWGEAVLKDDGHFRTRRGGAVTFIIEPHEDWQVRFWGRVNDYDYYEDTPDPQDRDGLLLELGIEATIQVGGEWSLRPFLGFSEYDAEGGDWEHQAFDIRLSVLAPELPFAGLRVTLTVGHLWADFNELHSLSGFTEKRDDRRLYVQISITSKALEDLLGFAPGISLTYQNWSSNINAFDFDRWDIGVNADILALTF